MKCSLRMASLSEHFNSFLSISDMDFMLKQDLASLLTLYLILSVNSIKVSDHLIYNLHGYADKYTIG